jgi:hypothetical protein
MKSAAHHRKSVASVVLRILACVISLVLGSPGLASAQVSLDRFGLKDVETTAQCMARMITAATASQIANAYWGPRALTDGECQQPREVIPRNEHNTSREYFMAALWRCTGNRVTSDEDPWVQRVGYATAVLLSAGVRDWDSGRSLLEKLVERTVFCERGSGPTIVHADGREERAPTPPETPAARFIKRHNAQRLSAQPTPAQPQ